MKCNYTWEADGETGAPGANVLHLLGLADAEQTSWQLRRYRDRRIQFHTLAAALFNKKAKKNLKNTHTHTMAAKLNTCECVS